MLYLQTGLTVPEFSQYLAINNVSPFQKVSQPQRLKY